MALTPMAPTGRSPRTRRRPPARAALAVSVAVALAGTGTAAADGSGGGDVGDGRISVSVTVTTPGLGRPVDPNGGTRTAQVRWTVEGVGTAIPGNLELLCGVPQGASPEPAFGVLYHYVGYDLTTGGVVYDELVCVPVSPDGPPPSPPSLPEPPTIEEVWRRADLPAPLVGLDPPERGITGLETRVWSDAPVTVRIDASIRGYRVVGTAVLTGYLVRIDDDAARPSDGPGDPDHPLARHMFERKGAHTVRISAVWEGTNTFTGPGLGTPITAGIGTATVTATRAYDVHEVRAVLQP